MTDPSAGSSSADLSAASRRADRAADDRDAVSDLTVTGDEFSPAPDQPRTWRRAALVAGAVAVAFVLGVGAGYVGRGRATPVVAPSPAPATTARPVDVTVRPTGGWCWDLDGDRLIVGIELRNAGPGPVDVQDALVRLPLGGLHLISVSFNRCLVDATEPGPVSLAEGEEGWVAAWLHVLDECPQPLPVLFTVLYTDEAQTLRESGVGGFSDLGRIEFPNCAT